MKTVIIYLIYVLALFNLYAWMMWPTILFYAMFKWSAFVILVYAPLIYSLREKKHFGVEE